MKQWNALAGYGALLLLVVLVVPLLIGCGVEVAADATASEIAYTGALDASYEEALDGNGQLALGTLQLEGTANAVTAEQAAALSPLWEMHQDGIDLNSIQWTPH